MNMAQKILGDSDNVHIYIAQSIKIDVLISSRDDLTLLGQILIELIMVISFINFNRALYKFFFSLPLQICANFRESTGEGIKVSNAQT